MERDQYSQLHPDYDTDEPGYSGDTDVTTERRKHGRRGKITRDGNRKACLRYRQKNRGKVRATRREYMRRWRAARVAMSG